MSFTLVHYKDGKPVPVKMSIWDAFKGVPPLRPRHHRCPSCNYLHKPGEKFTTTVAQNRNRTNKEENKKNNSHSTSDKEEYSSKDDAKIIEMKADNVTWAKILEAIGKNSKSQLIAHWKTIDPARNHSSTNIDASGNANDNQSKQEQKRAKAQKNREQGLKKQAEKHKTKGDNSGETRNEIGDTSLRQLAEKYDKQKWMTVASKHFDMTGQRISPAQARKMAEGK